MRTATKQFAQCYRKCLDELVASCHWSINFSEPERMDIARLILDILILILILWITFFKSYVGEKGKNTATLEDGEKITKLIEGIKSELDFLTKSKFDIKSEERRAVVEWYEKYCLWLNTLLDCYYSNIDYVNYKEELPKINMRIDESYFKFQVSEAKTEIFVSHENLGNIAQNLKIATLKMQKLIVMIIPDLQLLYYEAAQAYDQTNTQEFKKVLADINRVRNEMIEKRNVEYREVLTHKEAFRKSLYEHIQSLLQ